MKMDRTVFDIMKQNGIVPGMAVVSLKGHDQGRVYLVIMNEGRFVWLAEGKIRSITKMKKKRCSHIKPLGQAADLDLIASLRSISHNEADIKIRKIISDFLLMD